MGAQSLRWFMVGVGLVVLACAPTPPTETASIDESTTSTTPSSSSACVFDPAGDVDCIRACASYREGFELNTKRGVDGEFMTPDQCPELCASFNDALNHAQPDTVIQWNCLAEHPMCSPENRQCQRTCLAQAQVDGEPAQAALCLAPGDASPGA